MEPPDGLIVQLVFITTKTLTIDHYDHECVNSIDIC